MVVPECRAGPAILFAGLRVPHCIIHRCHVGFHDEILHRGITYTYAWPFEWSGTYECQVSILLKKNSVRSTIALFPEIFLKNFSNFQKFFFEIFLKFFRILKFIS